MTFPYFLLQVVRNKKSKNEGWSRIKTVKHMGAAPHSDPGCVGVYGGTQARGVNRLVPNSTPTRAYLKPNLHFNST